MDISIDGELCTGHGRCYSLAPDLFEPDDEGRGVALVRQVDGDLELSAHRAADGCPERAVVVA